jgi:hypothetical protein
VLLRYKQQSSRSSIFPARAELLAVGSQSSSQIRRSFSAVGSHAR